MEKEKIELVEDIEKTLEQLSKSHVPETLIVEQAEIFKKGLPFVKLVRPCTIEDGITIIERNDFSHLIDLHENASRNGRIIKFVPASGAATRMFKDLLAVSQKFESLTFEALEKLANSDNAARNAFNFLKNLEKFAFYDDLKSFTTSLGKDLSTLQKNGEWKQILSLILTPEGMNYANLPKGLIPFHSYVDGSRTPLREHLEEAFRYTLKGDNTVSIQFTLAHEHIAPAQKHFDKIKQDFEGISFDICTSVQKPSTDTIAVTLENEAFKDASGKLNFRPGGHGALLENLNDFKADIVIIKNIDNVNPDRLKSDTVLYKKLLCGLLIETQNKIFDYLNSLETENFDNSLLEEIQRFAHDRLSIGLSENFQKKSLSEKATELFFLLNRPLRVCGMVKNEGEPGGGPFWIVDEKQNGSIQIVESAQVDVKNPDQKNILISSTHFNPVDLTCGLRNFKGKCFDLNEFSNKHMGFITIKSKDGSELKALELPGLWNGAMAFWNTVFVEVPSSTFTPVKIVNDLLRPEHQP